MRMFRTLMLAGVGFASVAAMSIATPAHADWRWRHGPHGWVRFWGAPVVVVGPPVVYAAPPVVYAPPPVVYAPAPVYYAPPVVVAPIGIGIHIR